MKHCFKCNLEKPVDQFYRHPKMADGRLGKCKDCTKADVKAHRRTHPERQRIADRQKMRRYRADGRYAEKIVARNALNHELHMGRLERPAACWHCGGEKPEAHHASYAEDMRLFVTWLCRPCHQQVHS